MKLGNIDGRTLLITGDGQGIDVSEASSGRFGPEIQKIYEDWTDFCAWACADTFAQSVPTRTFSPEEIDSPSPRPRQVFAIGLNYADHAGESGVLLPSEPAVFTKFVTSISGPNTRVELPADGFVDWEVELVVIIGRHAYQVSEGDAWEYVAGLTVGQDISERKLQHIGMLPQFSLAKSHPGFSPMGPFLVTPDEVDDPTDLELSCSIDGEEVQKSRTSKMVFSVATLIKKISAVTPLLPGDVIFSGTPSGVGGARKPPRFLAAGEQLVSKIEGIGEISQTFTSASIQ